MFWVSGSAEILLYRPGVPPLRLFQKLLIQKDICWKIRSYKSLSLKENLERRVTTETLEDNYRASLAIKAAAHSVPPADPILLNLSVPLFKSNMTFSFAFGTQEKFKLFAIFRILNN